MRWNANEVSVIGRRAADVFGENVHIVGKRPVYGGDINRSYRLFLSDGSSVFMKCNKPGNYPFFEKETEGLAALRSVGRIGVPKPLASGVDETERISFLLMEFLVSSPRRKDYWETLGRELALMHRGSTGRFVMGRKYADDSLLTGDDESGDDESDGNRKGTASEDNSYDMAFIRIIILVRLCKGIRQSPAGLNSSVTAVWHRSCGWQKRNWDCGQGRNASGFLNGWIHCWKSRNSHRFCMVTCGVGMWYADLMERHGFLTRQFT